jgi:hypothetical protein
MVDNFPVLCPYRLRNNPDVKVPKTFPWAYLVAFEDQVKKNHYQTLEQLAGRGGLSPIELVAVLNGVNPDVLFAAGMTEEIATERLAVLIAELG